MGDPGERQDFDFDFELLKRYGAKWAVLAAMCANMAKKGIEMPPAVFEEIRAVRGRIESGCFSPCEASCELAQIEGQLFSQCNLVEPQEFQEWCDLLAEAMQGKLDYQRIQGIAALAPVKNDCRFLGCNCPESR
jgi:hypothetical protein